MSIQYATCVYGGLLLKYSVLSWMPTFFKMFFFCLKIIERQLLTLMLPLHQCLPYLTCPLFHINLEIVSIRGLWDFNLFFIWKSFIQSTIFTFKKLLLASRMCKCCSQDLQNRVCLSYAKDINEDMLWFLHYITN